MKMFYTCRSGTYQIQSISNSKQMFVLQSNLGLMMLESMQGQHWPFAGSAYIGRWCPMIMLIINIASLAVATSGLLLELASFVLKCVDRTDGEGEKDGR